MKPNKSPVITQESSNIDNIKLSKIMDSFHVKENVGKRITTIELKDGTKLEAGMPTSDLLTALHIPKLSDLEKLGNNLASSLFYTQGTLFKDGSKGAPYVEVLISGGRASDSAKSFLKDDVMVQKTDMKDRELNVMLKAVILGEIGESVDFNFEDRKVDCFIKDYNYPWATTAGGKKIR